MRATLSPLADGSSPAVGQPLTAGATPVLAPPQAVVGRLLDENLIRDIALDADGDTVLYEKIAALTQDDFCSPASKTCTASDGTALAKARAASDVCQSRRRIWLKALCTE